MFCLSMFMCRDALNALHATLFAYLFFKQQPDTWHNLSGLCHIAFIQTIVIGKIVQG